MKATKKPPRCWNTETAKGRRKAGKPSPLPFYQIEGSFTRMTITEILKHGRENAIRAEILAAKLETTPRGLRRQIMLAREQGEIILYAPGGYGGYFLPSENPEAAQREMQAFYHVQAARCKHGLKAIAPVARKLGIPLGQMDLDSYL